MNAGPWPNTRRWHSSWAATASSASGGARTRRQLNDRLPLREQLPQRLVVSRIVTRAGRDAERRARGASIARVEGGAGARAEPGLEDGRRRAPVAGDPLDEQLVAVVAADARDARRARCRGGAGDDADPVRRPEVRHAAGRRPARAGRRGGPRAPPGGRGGAGSRPRARRGTP